MKTSDEWVRDIEKKLNARYEKRRKTRNTVIKSVSAVMCGAVVLLSVSAVNEHKFVDSAASRHASGIYDSDSACAEPTSAKNKKSSGNTQAAVIAQSVYDQNDTDSDSKITTEQKECTMNTEIFEFGTDFSNLIENETDESESEPESSLSTSKTELGENMTGSAAVASHFVFNSNLYKKSGETVSEDETGERIGTNLYSVNAASSAEKIALEANQTAYVYNCVLSSPLDIGGEEYTLLDSFAQSSEGQAGELLETYGAFTVYEYSEGEGYVLIDVGHVLSADGKVLYVAVKN